MEVDYGTGSCENGTIGATIRAPGAGPEGGSAVDQYPFMPLEPYEALSDEVMEDRAQSFYELMKRRRTVRDFADRPVSRRVIERCIQTAGTAPSGANQQPWQFVVVTDAGLKRRIRVAAEAEEQAFYEHRASAEWLEALAPLGTDARKPFLEIAPCLIVIFAQTYGVKPDGSKAKHYYVQESVGIATGLLIAALHQVGLATLTHTPSPMKFLNEILDRPAHERPFLVLVVGYPAPEAMVPVLRKKGLKEIARFL